ncbi:MAG: carbon-nitrogen hydrolase family protein [Litorimonas sp.]
MKAAIVQMNSGIDVQENIRAATEFIRKAAGDGAQFVATPEMTHLMQRDGAALRKSVRPQDTDLGVQAFSETARSLGIYLLIGSLAILREDGKIANRSFVFGPDGQIIGTYDKINLFEAAISKTDTWREADTYAAGEQSVLAGIDDLELGLSICYDLRFANLYKGYAHARAHMISVPAAFTRATGKAHWETLLRARAIETGAYIIAPAQGGTHEDGRKTWGHSMIIGPWGEVVAHIDHNKPGYVLADIKRTKIDDARSKIPAWQSV